MFTYVFDNPRQYNELLQFSALFLIFVIGLMVYFTSQKTNDLKSQISQLELECPSMPEIPACPSCPESKECPTCPSCPSCPSLTCNEGECPDCNCPPNKERPKCPDCNKTCPKCPDSNHTCPECPDCNKRCPKCPDCKANAKCPTVEDIVGGIFPGRNSGITKDGKYFDVDSSESYDLMPDNELQDSQSAFSSDSFLSPKSDDQFYSNFFPSKNTMKSDTIITNTNTTLSRSLGGPHPKEGGVSLDDMPRMGSRNIGIPGNGVNNSISINGLPSATRSLKP